MTNDLTGRVQIPTRRCDLAIIIIYVIQVMATGRWFVDDNEKLLRNLIVYYIFLHYEQRLIIILLMYVFDNRALSRLIIYNFF